MRKALLITYIASFVGVVSGLLSSSFLYLLDKVTQLRMMNSFLIFLLPAFAMFFAFIIKKIPYHIKQGVPYILNELENENSKVSPWMAPFIFLSSLGTHLFGGSAGREGVGVIMGVSAAHLLPSFHKKFADLRPYLIYGGVAAGFSSIFGTPLAAIIFSFELHSFRDFKDVRLLICTSLSSLIAFTVSNHLGPSHQHFSVFFSWNEVIPYFLITGLVSGLGAHFFFWGMKGYTKLISHIFPDLYLKLGIGTLMISLLVFYSNGYQYVGIGTEVIANSFLIKMSYFDFMMKALFTIMTLSIGLKGGEVTPLFFMGSTLSNWTCGLFDLSNFGLSSSLGMVALFGAVTATPISSSILGGELFGADVGILCLVSSALAKLVFGKRSLYRH